jgi:hypothetical protein
MFKDSSLVNASVVAVAVVVVVAAVVATAAAVPPKVILLYRRNDAWLLSASESYETFIKSSNSRSVRSKPTGPLPNSNLLTQAPSRCFWTQIRPLHVSQHRYD